MDIKTLKESLDENGVKFCFSNYVNIHGSCMGKMVTLDKIASLTDGTLRFAGVSSDGLGQKPHELEVSAIADLNSATILPWRPKITWFACDLYRYGEPHPQCSRGILSRIIKKAKEEFGISFNIGIEAEMYLVTRLPDGSIMPYYNHEPSIPAYNLSGTLALFDFLEMMTMYMNDLGWDVSTITHEGGKSQVEFSFGWSDPITAADRYTFLRVMAKEVAQRIGGIATFMPKPFTEDLGSAAHINISLVSPNELAIKTRNGFYELSEAEHHFIGGILKHAKAITAITCPTVNSYKRLVSRGFLPDISWAPIYIEHGPDNRTAMVRVPTQDRRIEYRAADSSCNPYLALAMVIGAGLDGIRRQISPGEPRTDNLYEISDTGIKEQQIKLLPKTLLEAIDWLDSDNLSRDILGNKLKSDYLSIKRAEWAEYFYRVSNWELDTYLEW